MRHFIRLHWQDFKLPLSEVKNKGFEIIAYEHFGIGDCTIIEIDRTPDPLPKNWYLVSSDFKFSTEPK